MHFWGPIMPLSRFLPMVFAAAMSLYPAAGWGAEPVKIRMSWIAPISNWGSLLLEKKELAQHLGKIPAGGRLRIPRHRSTRQRGTRPVLPMAGG